MKILRFLLQFTVLGLAAAFVIVAPYPELLQPTRVVTIHESTAATPVNAPKPAPARAPLSFSAAVARAAPTVVNIYSARVVRSLSNQRGPLTPAPDMPSGDNIQTGLGSGVIFSTQGYVLTNEHVIAGADEIQAMLTDGRSARARVVGIDADTDLAVLKIDLKNLSAITLGDSDKLRVGDVVLAIGNPYAVGQTVTMGIVSATGRRRLGLSTYEDYIQTDAAINPGNSGGALINTNGDLVGLNTAIFSRTGGSQGIGFAIPAALARHVMTEIIEHGHVIRGWIGISMERVTPEDAEQAGLKDRYGVVVIQAIKDSPAERAGLRSGDILLRIDKQRIYDPRHMLDLVARERPGKRVSIEGIRGRRAFRVQVAITERPAPTQHP